MQREWDEERARTARAVRAIFVVYGGVLASVIGPFLLAPEGMTESLATGLAVAIQAGSGVLGALLLGTGGFAASVPARLSFRMLGVTLLGAMAMVAVTGLYVLALDAVRHAEPEPFEADFALLFVYVVLLAPVLEEWLCRGVLWTAARRVLSRRGTVLLTATLFALLHGLGPGVFLELPHRFAAGVVLGLLRTRTGSLTPGVLAHALHNAVFLLWLP